jgi:hypothetical protein
MLITTLLLIGAAIGAVACLSLKKVKQWLRSRAKTKYGDLIMRDLRDGKVEIMAIGLTKKGVETGRKTWTAKSLDTELAATFGSSERVRITVR